MKEGHSLTALKRCWSLSADVKAVLGIVSHVAGEDGAVNAVEGFVGLGD